MSLSPRNQYGVLIGLLVVFGAVFVLRGPVRAFTGGADLEHLYAAASVWLSGGNPYDGAQCVEAMRQAGAADPQRVGNGSFYPPPTIAVLSPLGTLGWDVARLTWLAINMIGCGVLIWALSHWLKISSLSRRWMLAALILLTWAPVMTALSLGQLSITAASCLFAGLILLEKGRAYLPGLLIAAGCLIKPQLGLGFLVLLGLRRDWLALGVAVVAIALFTGIGISRLMQTAPAWSSTLADNLSREQAPGGMLDASIGGAMRYQMCDVRPLFHLVLPGEWVSLAALLFVAVLAAIAIVKLIWLGIARHTLLAVSGVGLLVLLPVYHRVYDAVLLLPLLALVVNQLMRQRSDGLMALIGLMMLPLFLPLPSLLAVMHGRGVIPDNLHNNGLWRHVVLQHQSWCLLIAAVALVVWTCRLQRSVDGVADAGQQAGQGAPA